MGVSEFIIAAIPIFLSIIIPGVAIALPLLRNSKLSLFEIICFGFTLGLIVPTVVTYTLNTIGFPYSFTLTIAGIIITTAIGMAWFFYEARNEPDWFRMKVPQPIFSFNRDSIPLVILLMMLLAFFIRVQSIGPVFYEFDPYFYMYIARQLLVVGHVPLVDNTAWYPGPGGHGTIVLTGYLESGWYNTYTAFSGISSSYNNLLLSTIANVYPPVVGALICFFAYMLVKEEYGHLSGVVAAGFMAITPRLIEKFVAGEAEITPWGVFSTFLFLSSYAMAVNRSDKRLAVLAGIAFMSTYIGSAYTSVVTLIFFGFAVFESFKRFYKMETLKSLLEINAIILAFVLLSYVVRDVPRQDSITIPPTILLPITSLAVIAALYFIEHNSKKFDTRVTMSALLIIAGFVLLLVTPIGGVVFQYAMSAVGFAKPNSALMQTVAEEHPLSPAEFAGEAKRSFGLLGSAVSELSLWSENGNPISIPLGIPLPNPIGGNSIYVPFLLVATFIVLVLAIALRNSKLALLFIFMIFPISFVGLQKSKYTVQFGFMLIIAIAVLLGELYILFLRGFDEKEKKTGKIVYGVFIAGLLLAGFYDPLADVMPTALTFQPGDCSKLMAEQNAGIDKQLSLYVYCTRIPAYWLDSMDWISKNVHEDDAVMSWWDYGHWTNFFGNRRTVTRNEHSNVTMDLMVADVFVEGTPEDLKQTMQKFNATHVLFDIDLVSKWGALKYLSCVYNNQTNMSVGPGTSTCDQLYDFEYIYVPAEPALNQRCIIKGQVGQYLPLAFSSFGVNYCVGQSNVGGKTVMVLFNVNQSNLPNDFDISQGVVTVNRAIPLYMDRVSIEGKPYDRFLSTYPELWYDGQSGLPDRKGKAYDSNFYRGFFLGKIDGFELVYPEGDPGGLNIQPVRIFKIKGS